jgi:hypothetical protein
MCAFGCVHLRPIAIPWRRCAAGLLYRFSSPRPIECRSSADRVPIECRSSADRVPIECQSSADRVPIECQSSADRVPIECQSSAFVPRSTRAAEFSRGSFQFLPYELSRAVWMSLLGTPYAVPELYSVSGPSPEHPPAAVGSAVAMATALLQSFDDWSADKSNRCVHCRCCLVDSPNCHA